MSIRPLAVAWAMMRATFGLALQGAGLAWVAAIAVPRRRRQAFAAEAAPAR